MEFGMLKIYDYIVFFSCQYEPVVQSSFCFCLRRWVFSYYYSWRISCSHTRCLSEKIFLCADIGQSHFKRSCSCFGILPLSNGRKHCCKAFPCVEKSFHFSCGACYSGNSHLRSSVNFRFCREQVARFFFSPDHILARLYATEDFLRHLQLNHRNS
eukprot:284816139_5